MNRHTAPSPIFQKEKCLRDSGSPCQNQHANCDVPLIMCQDHSARLSEAGKWNVSPWPVSHNPLALVQGKQGAGKPLAWAVVCGGGDLPGRGASSGPWCPPEVGLLSRQGWPWSLIRQAGWGGRCWHDAGPVHPGWGLGGAWEGVGGVAEGSWSWSCPRSHPQPGPGPRLPPPGSPPWFPLCSEVWAAPSPSMFFSLLSSLLTSLLWWGARAEKLKV